MTTAVDLGRKATKQTNKYSILVLEMFYQNKIYISAVCGRVPLLLQLGNCLLTIRTAMLRYSGALTGDVDVINTILIQVGIVLIYTTHM